MMASPPEAVSELRLLRTSLSGGQRVPTTIHQSSSQVLHLLDTLLRLIEAGRYLDALQCSGARLVLGTEILLAKDKDGPQQFYQGVREKALKVRGTESGALLAIAVGVAALYAFVQVNILGPQASFPSFPLASSGTSQSQNADLVEEEDADGFADFAASIQSGIEGLATTSSQTQCDLRSDWDDWARRELVVDGTDVLGRYALPQYLLLARILLVESHIQGLGLAKQTEPQPPAPSETAPPTGELDPLSPAVSLPPPERSGGPRSGQWWAARTLLVEQRLLSEHSASLQKAIALLLPEVLQNFGTAQAVQKSIPGGDAWRAGEAGAIAGVACLEGGLAQHAYRQTDSAAALFQRAARECGLNFEITGALGFRTPHQVNLPKFLCASAFLLVVTEASTGNASDVLALQH
jgi:hypothetical protein